MKKAKKITEENYENTFQALSNVLPDCLVIDFPRLGWVADVSNYSLLINIDSRLKHPYRLFTLLHEVGHYFQFAQLNLSSNLAGIISRRKEQVGEEEANCVARWMAVSLFRDNSLEAKYDKFYADIVKNRVEKYFKK